MIKLNKEQYKWFKESFCLSKRDMPTDYYDKVTDFVDDITGHGDFRGIDYHMVSDGYSFVDVSYMALTATDSNKEKFSRIFTQLLAMQREAMDLEYYESYANIQEVLANYELMCSWNNESYIDKQLYILLDKTKVTLP